MVHFLINYFRQLIRVTSEEATLPAAAADTDPQPAITLQCSDSESDDDGVTDAQTVADQEGGTCGRRLGTPAAVAEAKARQFRHATVAPKGAPPTPDPRLLEWHTPKTNRAPAARRRRLLLRRGRHRAGRRRHRRRAPTAGDPEECRARLSSLNAGRLATSACFAGGSRRIDGPLRSCPRGGTLVSHGHAV